MASAQVNGSDREAFIRAICESPADDTPRLIFADWLEEQGNKEDRDRAEFIRVQIKLAGMENTNCLKTGEPTEWHKYVKRCRCSICRLRQREYYSGRKHINWKWSKPMKAGDWHRFHRGFVDMVKIYLDDWWIGTHRMGRSQLADWMEHGASVLENHPIVEVITEKLPFDTLANLPRDMPLRAFETHKPEFVWNGPLSRPAILSDELPAEVYNRLPQTRFATRKAAIATLSNTLIAIARRPTG